MTNIVLLVRDRYRLTQQALESLYEHTPLDQFNLTIVDDGSTDFRTVRVLEMIYQKHPNIFLVTLNNSGHILSQCKNSGVYASEQRFGRGDWLYLSDNDVYFKPSWLEDLTYVAVGTENTGDFALWGGQIHPYHKAIELTEDHPIAFVEKGVDKPFKVKEYSVLDGPSWLMRWNTWSIVGPFKFDCAPGPCQSEEYPFCEHLKMSHKRIGVIHPHVVVHCGIMNTNGEMAPGATERLALQEPGILYE